MANVIGSLLVELGLNSAAWNTGLNKAQVQAKAFGQQVQGAFSKVGSTVSQLLGSFSPMGGAIANVMNVAGNAIGKASSQFSELGGMAGFAKGAIAGLGVVVLAVAASFFTLALAAFKIVDNLDEISQKTGISIRDLQMFQAVGSTVGVSLDAMVMVMRKFSGALNGLSNDATASSKALRALGVTARDPKEALMQVAEAFSKMEDGTKKAALAATLFGRAGLNMIPMLNKGRKGIEEYAARVERLGPVIDANAIQKSIDWEEANVDLGLTFDKLKVNMIDFLGILTSIVSGIAEVVNGIADFYKKVGTGAADTFAFFAGGIKGMEALQEYREELKRVEEDNKKIKAFNQGFEEKEQARWKNIFDVMRTGGAAALALEKKKQEISDAQAEGKFKEAVVFQQQLSLLEEAVVLEKAAAKETERRKKSAEGLAEAYAKIWAGSVEARGLRASIDVPEMEPPDISFDETGLGKLFKIGPEFDAARAAIAAFYAEQRLDSVRTVAEINDGFRQQLLSFQNMFTLGQISQEEFSRVSADIEGRRVRALAESSGDILAIYNLEIQRIKEVAAQYKENAVVQLLLNAQLLESQEKLLRTWSAAAVKVGDLKQRTTAMLMEVYLVGRNFGEKVFESFGKAIDDMSTKLADFVITGKLSFKSLFEDLGRSILKAGFQKLFSGIAGGLLGGAIGGKPDGTQGNPIYTRSADALGGILGEGEGGTGGILGKIFGKIGKGKTEEEGGGIGKLFGGFKGKGGIFAGGAKGEDGFMSKMSGVMSKMFSGIGSFFTKMFSSGGFFSKIIGGISSIFGGFLAAGGDVTPGKAYVVGEKRPEIFLPRTAGRVVPSLQSGAINNTNLNVTFTGVTDMDTFKKNRAQIAAEFYGAASLAYARAR